MIRFGVFLIPTAITIFILSNVISFFIINVKVSLILFISSIAIGVLGLLLIFIGVVRDRIKEKRGEDQDDLSKY
ncbi:hypothetical protein [Lentibacillus amyloliquefaciens]|uniref:Uncharacterized protein n=1 Tax=Lentibacillus amyloliquefaciens TaxID=1472767 RepID=A0A0U4E3Z9_9BACI|nr:hypothetical protein [Lentibacillus amyloliquefaciens]ALX47633.1 hypothetical protein AOX59_02855 [Lentibacillus amyloliquefaciens]